MKNELIIEGIRYVKKSLVKQPKFEIREKVITDSGIKFEIRDIEWLDKHNSYFYYRNPKNEDNWAWDEENLKRCRR